jgi:hypothetical protein
MGTWDDGVFYPDSSDELLDLEVTARRKAEERAAAAEERSRALEEELARLRHSLGES